METITRQSSWLRNLLRAVALLLVVAGFPSSFAYATFGDGTPTVPNPGVFSSSYLPKVIGSSGALTQHIPLDIPPGRNGLQPDLSLDYNSQNTSDGIVGYGWTLSIPYIQRLNKAGSQTLYATTSFTSSIDGELALESTATPPGSAPTILDTLPISLSSGNNSTNANSMHGNTSGTSFTYTVPSGGSNKVLVVIIFGGVLQDSTLSITQNGVTVPWTRVDDTVNNKQTNYGYAYLANPTTGTFTATWSGGLAHYTFVVFTVNGADTTNPIDATAWHGFTAATSDALNITTNTGNTLLIGATDWGNDSNVITKDSAFTTLLTNANGGGATAPGNTGSPPSLLETYKAAGASAGTETETSTASVSTTGDHMLIAIRSAQPVATTTTTSAYRARVDDGSFNKYSYASSTNTWTMYDKKGTRYLFGSDDSGRQYDTSVGTSTQTYKWMLQEIRDTNGNYVKYTYSRDSNEMYPSQIIYTGNGSTEGPFTISFATSTRSDTRESYASGFKVTTGKRISEIDAAKGNTTLRKYVLAYTTGNNGYRSLLSGIYPQGYDDSGNLTTFPGTTFEYMSSSTQSFYQPNGITSQAWQVGDTNGNGISDVNQFTITQGTGVISADVYLDHTGLDTTSITPPGYWAQNGNPNQPVEAGWRYVDINGDGKADLIRGWQDQTNSTTDTVVDLNTYTSSSGTYGWSSTSTSGTIPYFGVKVSSNTVLTAGILGDVNGDGLPDFESSISPYVSPTAYLGNGQGFNATTTIFQPAQSFPTTGPGYTNSQLIDINGDGLDDWIYSDSGHTYVLSNTGTTWVSDSQWTIATSTVYKDPNSNTYYDRGMRFLDVNGDGLPDFVRTYHVNTFSCNDNSHGESGTYRFAYLNTGSGWATSSYPPPSYNAYSAETTDGSPCTWTVTEQEAANWNGNGQLYQDVISKINNSKGGSTSVLYKSSTKMSNPDLPLSLLVVSEQGVNDGQGNIATTTYTYGGGKVYLASGVRDRKFSGFAQATTTAPDAVTTTYYHQGSGLNTSRGEQSNGYGQINHPFRKDVFDLAGALKQKTLNRWDSISHGNGTAVVLGQELIELFNADGSHIDKATTYSYASTTNDLIEKDEWGQVNGNSDGTFTDTGSDKRTTTIAYAASSTVNMTVPYEVKVFDSNSATSSDTKLYYDSLAFGSVNIGNQTRKENWISGTQYASTTKTYNSYGLVATSTDANGNATSYVYDGSNLYLATSTNPLFQKTQYLYNYSNGKAAQTTDPNGRVTRNIYDGLGRVTEIDQSSTTTPSTVLTTTTFQYTDSSTTPTSIHRSNYLNSSATVDTYDYYDGLTRLIQERKQSQNSNTYAVTDRQYNLAGLLASTSFPYFSAGSAFTTQTTNTNLYTGSAYDTLHRIMKTNNAVGTTNNSYSNWTKTTTDPNGNIKDYTFDAFGNLTSVGEHLNGSTLTTTYTYDAASNLATTTDSVGDVRHFTYDGLNRRLTAQDLHVSTSTNYGTWTYTYDDAGNMTSQVDPKSQTVNRTYDAVNRLLAEDYTGQAGTEITNTYDNCTNGIGYLCTASSTSALTSNAYDILGQITTATTTINGTSYVMSYGYDRQGNLTGVSYPNGSQVSYGYNLAGLPNQVQRGPSGGSFSDIVTNFDYSPTSQITNTLFGNNASTTRNYDANALYRLVQLVTSTGSTTVQNFAYTYDQVGNITQMANTASTSARATVDYTYDSLNRLLTALASSASSSPYAYTYTYDKLGNILSADITLYATVATSSPPSILETLPLVLDSSTNNTVHGGGTSAAFSYTVPPGGSNKVLVVLFAGSDLTSGGTLTVTQNGVTVPMTRIYSAATAIQAYMFYGTLANPTSGTFSASWTSGPYHYTFVVFTVQNANLWNPVDATSFSNFAATTSNALTATTTSGNALLLSMSEWGNGSNSLTNSGTGEHDLLTTTNAAGNGGSPPALIMAWKNAGGVAGAETMTTTATINATGDHSIVAIKSAGGSSGNGTTTANAYTYGGTGSPNPDAVTQIANGLSTTTYGYDADGNLTSSILTSGSNSTTTLYSWDYANRLTQTAIGVSGGSTTTTSYAYDWQGNRVLQTVGATTTHYVGKWFSQIVGATSTSYVYSGDTLLATVDQTGTSTAVVSYIHPDHLGSTNVVTDSSGLVAKQTLDYYPYGATRINSSSGGTNIPKKYIGLYSDDSNLIYANARYYDPSRGQFLSEDPTFLGYPKNQDLKNPQSLNSYAYANGNPITNKDPSGRCVGPLVVVCIAGGVGAVGGVASQAFSDYLSGDFSQRTWQENLETYSVAAANGATVGAGTAVAVLLAPEGLAGTAIIGGTAGLLNAGTTVVGNSYLGEQTDPTNLVLNSSLSALTAGTLKTLPQVPGRLPNFGTKAFYSGVHTQRQAAEELFSSSVQSFSQSVTRFAASQNYSGGASQASGDGSSSGSLIQQLQALVGALQNYVSSLSGNNKSSKSSN